MARNVRKDDEAVVDLTPAQVAAELATKNPPVEEGGAPGVLNESGNPPVVQIPGMPEAPRKPEVGPKPKRYRVTGGPETIMYGSARYPLKVGKEYADNHVSIAHLKAQGVRFEEIEEPKTEE